MDNDIMGEDEVDEVFRGVCMAQMSNDGRLKRVHDSTVTLEVCPRQYDAEIRVVKGCQFLCSGVRYVLGMLTDIRINPDNKLSV